MSTEVSLAGINLDRRGAITMAGRLAATAALFGLAPPLLTACSAKTEAPLKDYRPLVMTLLDIVIPGAANAQNADFVARAVKAGMKGVPVDLLAQLEDALDAEAGGQFAKRSPQAQADAVRKIDERTFAPSGMKSSPWYAAKALLLMAFYTSEDGMTKELRYELVPGRYDSDVVIDANWRPLSNDWQAVAINGGILGK